MNQNVNSLPSYLFMTSFSLILARVNHMSLPCYNILKAIIVNIIRDYPQQAMWTVITYYNSSDEGQKVRMKEILSEVQALRIASLNKFIKAFLLLVDVLVQVCHKKIPGHQHLWWRSLDLGRLELFDVQVVFSTNVWCGVLGNQLIGPYFYRENLTGEGAQLLVPTVTSGGGQKGVTVLVSLAGQPRTLLVDSGSEVSLLKQPLENVPLCEPHLRATGVTGKALPIEGEQEALCQLREVSARHRFLIAEVHTIGDGLMGLDLMAKLGIILDTRESRIYLTQHANKSAQANLVVETAEKENPSGMGDPWRVVRAARRLEIPPHSEQMVEGKLRGERRGGDVRASPTIPRQIWVKHN
uniref:FAT domain-containing protein n=1 Tax=Rhodnius prolixus TaxID=13249 RepID=T1HN14_RHOPR